MEVLEHLEGSSLKGLFPAPMSSTNYHTAFRYERTILSPFLWGLFPLWRETLMVVQMGSLFSVEET